jgi:hypothetical protein
MLPTHGALHHVPLGGVAVGPSTAWARQALQYRDACCRQVTEISVKKNFRAEKNKELLK